MRISKRFKKIASLILSLAMVLTLMPTQFAYAAGSGSDGQPATVSDDDAKVPEPMLQFTFDDGITDNVITDVKGVAKATINGATVETPEDDAEGSYKGKVLQLSGNGYLKVTNKDNDKNPLIGKTALTISYWSKDAPDKGNTGWAYFIRKDANDNDYDNDQGYTAIIDRGVSVSTERYWGKKEAARVNGAAKADGLEASGWKQVTVVLDASSTKIYVNGEHKKTQSGQNKTGNEDGAHQIADYLIDGSIFQIGKANWGSGEYFDGKIDEFTVYDSALDAEQVKAAYNASFGKVDIKFVCGDKELDAKSIEMYGKTGITYKAYTPVEADKVISKDGTVYIREDGQTQVTPVIGENGAVTVTVNYKEASVESVTTTEFEAITRIGVEPKLPEKTGVTFEGGVTGEAPIEWTIAPEDYAAATTEAKTITGSVGGKPVTLALTVKDKEDYVIANYKFDEADTSAGWADATGKHGKAVIAADDKSKAAEIKQVEGLVGKAVELPGGSNANGQPKYVAAIQLPDELLKDNGAVQDDFTISAYVKRTEIGNCFAWSLLGSDGHGSNPSYYAALINKNGEFSAAYKHGSGDKTVNDVAKAKSPTPDNEWSHIAIVTKGSTGEVWLYQDGQIVAENTIGVKVSDLGNAAHKNNFLGRSAWPDADFKGAFDEFRVYSAALTQTEIQSICDPVLRDAQFAKTKDGLAIKNADGTKFEADNVTDDLSLPTEAAGNSASISWTSSDTNVVTADGKVIRPSGEGAEDAHVTLTANVKIRHYDPMPITIDIVVKAMQGVNVKPLTDAIAAAQKVLDNAKKKDIYSDASLAELQAAITEAEATLAEEDLDTAGVTTAVDKLNAAASKTFELKDFDALQKNLVAWYPLDKKNKVNDKSGKGKHGKVIGSNITFSNEDGATFKGTGILKDYISLPDTLGMTDQMTISFWMKRDGDVKNMLGFGSILNSTGSDAKHFHMRSELYTSMSNNGWSAHEDVTAAVDEELHHVTAVLDGKKYTIYIDGEKAGEKVTTISMADAWNAEGGKKYAYIGNCAYGHNNNANDKDFNGSIKDFRIYNVAMEEAQVKEVQAYIDTDKVAWNYAKEELIDEMKALQDEEGNITLNVHDGYVVDGKITLPKTSYGNAVITWASTDDNTINVKDMGADNKASVTLPAAEEDDKEVNLTATITMDGRQPATDTVVFKCTVFTRAGNVETGDLEAVIAQAEALAPDQAKYTVGSWKKLQTALTAAKTRKENPKTQALVDEAKGALEGAIAGLVDKSELDSKIAALEAQIRDLNKAEYTTASVTQLQNKLQAAKDVADKADATKEEIETAINEFPVMSEILVARGSKAELNKLAASAAKLEAEDYSDTTWGAFADKLAEVQGLGTDLSQAEIDVYYNALKATMDALVPSEAQTPTQAEKDGFSALVQQAEGLTADDYTAATWNDYQAALEDAQRVAAKANATKKEIAAAKKALEDAEAVLVIKDGKAATEDDKAALTAVTGEADSLTAEDYSDATWAAYQAAVEKAKAVAAKSKLTKSEVDKAMADLATARAALRPSEAQTPDQADKDTLSQAITDEGGLTQANYTPETWKTYADALAKAEELLNDPSATKNQMTAAKTALENAAKALVPTDEQKTTAEDKAPVNAAIEAAEALTEADYTPESWTAYQAAIAKIKKVMAKENLTKSELAKAGTDLEAAKELLVSAVTEIKVDSVTLNKTALTLAVKKTETLTATVNPSNATNPAKQWKSSNDKVAKVDQNGKVTAVAKGTANITVTAGGKSATCKVTVTVPVTNVKIVDSLGGGTKPAVVAGKKITLKANITPSNASNTSVTWSVDKKSAKLASIDKKKGVLSAKKNAAGKTVTVTATANDGSKKKATIKVKIMKNAVTKITLKAGKKTVKAGKKITVKATVKTNGKKASKTLAWSIDKKSAKYASINSKGVLSTKKTGKGKTVTVTATATDGTKKKATIKIKITK